MPDAVQFGQHAVLCTYNQLRCNCKMWANMRKKQLTVSRYNLSPVMCSHVAQVLRERLDSLPKKDGGFSVLVTSLEPIALTVTISWERDWGETLVMSNLATVHLDYPGIHEFLGYVAPESSRRDIREMLVPILLNYYLTHSCIRCKLYPSGYTRSSLTDNLKRAKMLRHAAYMIETDGVCSFCDDSDLIPNTSDKAIVDPELPKKKSSHPLLPDPINYSSFTSTGNATATFGNATATATFGTATTVPVKSFTINTSTPDPDEECPF